MSNQTKTRKTLDLWSTRMMLLFLTEWLFDRRGEQRLSWLVCENSAKSLLQEHSVALADAIERHKRHYPPDGMVDVFFEDMGDTLYTWANVRIGVHRHARFLYGPTYKNG